MAACALNLTIEVYYNNIINTLNTVELSDATFLLKIDSDTQVISTKVNSSNIRYTLKYLSMQQPVIYAC